MFLSELIDRLEDLEKLVPDTTITTVLILDEEGAIYHIEDVILNKAEDIVITIEE